MGVRNQYSISQTANTIASLMKINGLCGAAEENSAVCEKAKSIWGNEPAERILLYNPDAIAMWLFQKYTEMFLPVMKQTQLAIHVESVMPSVTPVCFASMYTGLMPCDHGIEAYVKPVLQVRTIFDAAIAAGKKPVIISTEGDSVSKIFLEREMDYMICKTPDECNQNAIRIIEQNEHDIVVVYNGNYDETMHRYGPESNEAFAQLKHNVNAFHELTKTAEKFWDGKRYVLGFLTDHGCHEIDGNLGSHGLDMPEDMQIVHFWGFRG